MNPFPCLNPPSQEAMLQALTILQNSIHYENGTVPLKDPHSNQCHSQLDYHITAIEAAFAAFKSRSDLHVADLKRYRNTLSPIHRLPNELLSSILLLSIDPRAYTLASLQKLGRVCKAWRAIVGNTPDFWTRIDFTAPPHVLRLFLQKSKNAGLNIECTVSATDSVLPSKVEDFIEMTHKYASRWTSFKYRGNATQRIMRNIESAGKEKLTELSVHYLWHYRQSWLFNLPKDAPLERISLTSASLDWTTAQLSKLKSLELKDLHMNPPELRTMVQILNASPRMEYLVLMGIVLDADDAARSASDGLLEGDEIRLDDLRSLLLKNVPPHFYTCFLNRIVAPRCQSLIVDAVPPTLFTVPSTSSDAQPARLFDLAKPIIRAAPKLSVSAHGRLNHIQFVTSPEPSEFPSVANAIPGLDLTFETDVPMADLERVARFVGAALAPPVLPSADDDDDQGVQDIEELLRTQVTLKVGKTWWWDDDQDILVFPPAVLQALHPYLVHLELGRGVDGTEAIQWLSRPLDAMAHTWYDALLEAIRGPYPHHEDEGDLFPCPRLSKVFLKAWSGDSDSIIPFLTNRWRQHGEDGYSSSGSSSRGTGTGTSASSSSRHSSPGVGHGSPVKLEELTLPNLVPVELKELYAQGFWYGLGIVYSGRGGHPP